MKILNFGSLNIDCVYEVEHFVRPGETISSINRHVYCGGKGLNQSIALARAGAQVFHAGAVGAADGQILCDALSENSVNIDHVKRLEGVATGHAIIQVDRNGQNCILLFGGANQNIAENQIAETLRDFSAGDYLILQNEINENKRIMELAHQKGMVIVFNPSPMDEKIKSLPLDLVDYFLLNELEAADLCNKKTDLPDEMSKQFPNAKIVLTLGEKGVRYKDRNLRLAHGIYHVPVVDTTAAGDTFTGFFIGSVAGGCSCEEALRRASVASSIAVSRKGAIPSIPTMREVRDFNGIYESVQTGEPACES